LPVKGDVNYRKHSDKSFSTDTDLLLDFDGDGHLRGIEVLCENHLPVLKGGQNE
jgi:hypothetical protein